MEDLLGSDLEIGIYSNNNNDNKNILMVYILPYVGMGGCGSVAKGQIIYNFNLNGGYDHVLIYHYHYYVIERSMILSF
jgi:hypothetical protein